MEQNIVALQGKVFTVDIQSMIGSTNYGWCLTSLPTEIILLGTDNIASNGVGPVTQRFYFGVVSSAAVNVDIHFALTCWSDLTKVADTFTAHVSIISGESVNFTPYSENAVSLYGYPCGEAANMKYGYPCSEAANMKYGYPCDQAETAKAIMPYGVFNSDTAAGAPFYKNSAAVNTPFYANNAAVGTPFYRSSAALNTPFYSGNPPAVAYGYPGYWGCR